MHDSQVFVPWMGITEIGNTGFRFVRLDLVKPGSCLEIKEIRAVSLFRDLEWKGSFSCSDERLDRIWRVGAATVHLNMQDYVWDGIKRDRLVWMGDLYPETKVISTVFGDMDVVRDSLDLVRDETPLPGWMNGMSTYSLWWIITQKAWFFYHGNQRYLEEQRGYLVALLQQVLSHIDEKGQECLPGGFLDWPTARDKDEIHAGVQALLRMALLDGAILCHALGEEELQRICWRVGRGLASPGQARSKQVQALKVLSGFASAARTNDSCLAREPLRGISTFYGYYVLQARAMAEDVQGAMDVIRTYWGGMLDLGATSFWEDFDLQWMENAGRIDEITPKGKIDVHASYGDHCYKGLRHSLCHGWAGGPTAWISEQVLGIQPFQPGFASVSIEPHLEDLDWAQGTLPTPRGIITVRHEKKQDGSIRSEIDLPRGINRART